MSPLVLLALVAPAVTHSVATLSPTTPTYASQQSVGPVAGSVSPQKPRRAESLTLTYDTTHEKAELPGGDDDAPAIFAVTSFLSDSGLTTSAVALVPDGDTVRRGSVRVPDDAVYAYVRFASRSAWDAGADHELMIHDSEGAPVRGARLPAVYLSADKFLDRVRDELDAFPDNFAAYRTKWFFSSVFRDADELETTVRADLRSIGDADSAVGLWARSYGHAILGDEPKARELVVECVERFPTSLAASRSVADYQYQCYAQSMTDATGAVERATARAAVAEPTSWFARESVRKLASSGRITLSDTRRICEHWLEIEPLQPEPALVLARAIVRDGGDLDEADRLARRALNGYLRGDTRLTGDVSGSFRTLMMPVAFRCCIDVAEARGDLAGVLGATLAWQRTQETTDAAPYELEAAAWERLGDRDRAVAAWGRAAEAGSASAVKALDRLGAAAASRTDERELAPEFSMRDLNGDLVELERMRGRVVVLNFWGLGCAPCKREIPQLNELVEAFEGRAVEFIAVAGDGRDEVRDYLAEHEFTYRQLASAGEVLGSYDVTGLPVHVVIDTDGRVAARFLGAGDERAGQISAVVERALSEFRVTSPPSDGDSGAPEPPDEEPRFNE